MEYVVIDERVVSQEGELRKWKWTHQSSVVRHTHKLSLPCIAYYDINHRLGVNVKQSDHDT